MFRILRRLLRNKFFPNILHYFGPMTSSLPLKSTFWAFWAIFCWFQPFTQLKHRNHHIKPWREFSWYSRNYFVIKFSKILHYFGPKIQNHPPSLPKSTFLANFSRFWGKDDIIGPKFWKIFGKIWFKKISGVLWIISTIILWGNFLVLVV